MEIVNFLIFIAFALAGGFCVISGIVRLLKGGGFTIYNFLLGRSYRVEDRSLVRILAIVQIVAGVLLLSKVVGDFVSF